VIKEICTIVCDEVRQEANGKLIIIGVYQGKKIAIPQIPFSLPSLTFYQEFESDRPGIRQVKMKLQHLESGKNIFEGMGAVNVLQPGTGISILRFPNVPIRAAGPYNFVEEFEGQTDHPVVVAFDVVLVIPPQPQQQFPGMPGMNTFGGV
jgi:uncharacterized protein DUF6941